MSIKKFYKITKTNKDTVLACSLNTRVYFRYSASKRMTQCKLTFLYVIYTTFKPNGKERRWRMQDAWKGSQHFSSWTFPDAKLSSR